MRRRAVQERERLLDIGVRFTSSSVAGGSPEPSFRPFKAQGSKASTRRPTGTTCPSTPPRSSVPCRTAARTGRSAGRNPPGDVPAMHLRRRVPLQFRQAGGSGDQTRGAGLEGVVGEDGRVHERTRLRARSSRRPWRPRFGAELAPRVELHGEVLHDACHLLVSRLLRPRRRRRGPAEEACGGKTIRSSRLARDPSEAVVADDRRPCVIRDYRAPCEEDFLPLKDAAASARVRRHALRSMFVGRGTFWLSRHNDEVSDFIRADILRVSTSWRKSAPRNRLKANTIRGMTEIRFGAKRNQG